VNEHVTDTSERYSVNPLASFSVNYRLSAASIGQAEIRTPMSVSRWPRRHLDNTQLIGAVSQTLKPVEWTAALKYPVTTFVDRGWTSTNALWIRYWSAYSEPMTSHAAG